MRTRIQKWGNSLGLRIPKAFAEEARIAAGSAVDLAIESGKLIVRPLRRGKYTLKELVRGINSKNVHREIDSGEEVGRENW